MTASFVDFFPVCCLFVCLICFYVVNWTVKLITELHKFQMKQEKNKIDKNNDK